MAKLNNLRSKLKNIYAQSISPFLIYEFEYIEYIQHMYRNEFIQIRYKFVTKRNEVVTNWYEFVFLLKFSYIITFRGSVDHSFILLSRTRLTEFCLAGHVSVVFYLINANN